MNDGLVDITESITGNLEEFKTKMRSGRATGKDLANLFGMGELYDKSKERSLKVSFAESVAESMSS